MGGWAEGIQDAVSYMEEHLTDEVSVRDIAARAHVSEFHFQRIFSALCGVSVGEYIRCRRLTLAGEMLSAGSAKVIDAAVLFGYDSPDSFARAFTRFHGISPSAAKEKGARLNAFAPLHIKLTLEGGTMLEYRIVKKAAFTVMGKSRRFDNDTSYQEIPKFWEEHMHSADSKVVCGMYGLCMDSDGKSFDYLIADNYVPWNDVPEGFETRVLPAGTWAVFPCRGALPDALQSVNTKIWNEWLPSAREYKLGGNYNIEMYTPDQSYSEIWIPVVKA